MSNRILSINGNKPMNFLLKSFLSEKYKIITADDVSEGISNLKRKDIELIIIDLDSNTNENLDFIHYIRSSWIYKRPFIVLSSKESVVNNLNKEIFINSLLKPFNPVDLLNMTDQLVSKNVKLSA